MLAHDAHILCITSEIYVCTTTRHSERYIQNTRMQRSHPVTQNEAFGTHECFPFSHSERHIRNIWMRRFQSPITTLPERMDVSSSVTQNDTFGRYECIASSHAERHIRNSRMHQFLNMTHPEQTNVSFIHSERHIQNIRMHHIHSLRATVRYHSW